MHALKRANLSRLILRNANVVSIQRQSIGLNHVSQHTISNYEKMENGDGDENCLWLQIDDKKHILVMGIFHHCYASTLTVQNAINTLKPDTVFLELCPWRGMKVEKIQDQYSKTFHFSPRDVESAAIFTATRLGCKIVYGDVPEPVIKNELKKYDENIFNILSASQISMNEFEFYNHGDSDADGDVFIQSDANGKQYIVNENGDKYDVESREGVRQLMKINNEKYLNEDVKRILYDDREKYMIKAMTEAPDSQTMVAIVGMAHLDGIEKYWKDDAFWKDKEFWSLTYPKPNKWDVKRYNLLLNEWFTDNFPQVARWAPKFLKQGGN